MNTKILLTAVVAAFAFTSFASHPLLSPRAAGNQIQVVNSSVATPSSTVAFVDATPALLSPRAVGNQIKVVKGVVTDTNPALVCRNNMNGSPRAVTECSSHATMPGCATLARLN
jgi:hypothetical protein